ncbi:MAG: triose-phosphate isomerase [Planctomycetota bacterium]|nr:MAG: triose-phosphate isomerase [Planctomycetota bacterium]
MSRMPIIAGNWKMHLTRRRAAALARAVAAAQGQADGRRCVVFPAFVHLEIVRRNLKGSNVQVGAQNCHEMKEGAFTGEISAPMLRDMGAQQVLVGHSERRHVFGETDARVAAKLAAVLANRMAAMVCVGETLEERESERTLEVLQRQIQALAGVLRAEHHGRFSVAYEPVWAIGTGRTATPRVAQEAHAAVRRLLAGILGAEMAARTPVLYGGSVKPGNADELLGQPDVDGLLVGGASLDIESFGPILAAAPSA